MFCIHICPWRPMHQATSSCCLGNRPLGGNSHLFCLSWGKIELLPQLPLLVSVRRTVCIGCSETLATVSFHAVADIGTHSISLNQKSSCFRMWKGQSFLMQRGLLDYPVLLYASQTSSKVLMCGGLKKTKRNPH